MLVFLGHQLALDQTWPKDPSKRFLFKELCATCLKSAPQTSPNACRATRRFGFQGRYGRWVGQGPYFWGEPQTKASVTGPTYFRRGPAEGRPEGRF